MPFTRRSSLVILVLLALTVGLAQQASAASFLVTRFDDPPVDGCAPGDCSLREAIEAADAAAGTDEVLVPSGVYFVTDSNLSVDDETVIRVVGAGSAMLRGDGSDRVLHVSGDLTISRVIITGGRLMGETGAGVRVEAPGSLTMSNSLITGNVSELGDGGGVGSVSPPPTFPTGGTIRLSNVTISGNAAEEGGGIGVPVGMVELNNVTVTDNIADSDQDGTGDGGGVAELGGTITMRNTIVAGNRDNSPAPATQAHDCFNSPASQGYNLIGDTSGCGYAAATGDRTNVDPRLGPLQNNGGPVFTHALLVRSPAIDAAHPGRPATGGGTCERRDARDARRPRARRCDMGSYERLSCMGVLVNRVGTPGDDLIVGTPGDDGIIGQNGDDRIRAKAGDDAVCGGRGDTVLRGGRGDDRLRGWQGDDVFVGGGGSDACIGDGGADRSRGCERRRGIP